MAMWCPRWTLAMSVHSKHVYACRLVGAPVIEYLIAAVMHPHYAPIPWPSHPAYWFSPGGLGSLGFPFYPLLHLPIPYPSDSNLPHPPACTQCEVLSRTDLSLLLTSDCGIINWTLKGYILRVLRDWDLIRKMWKTQTHMIHFFPLL